MRVNRLDIIFLDTPIIRFVQQRWSRLRSCFRFNELHGVLFRYWELSQRTILCTGTHAIPGGLRKIRQEEQIVYFLSTHDVIIITIQFYNFIFFFFGLAANGPGILKTVLKKKTHSGDFYTLKIKIFNSLASCANWTKFAEY